jgi:hypothetical protein
MAGTMFIALSQLITSYETDEKKKQEEQISVLSTLSGLMYLQQAKAKTSAYILTFLKESLWNEI